MGATVVNSACNKVNAAVQRDVNLSGRVAVVQTGPNGLQVWCELREVREQPRKWVAEHNTREWYKGLGRRILKSARSAGARGGFVRTVITLRCDSLLMENASLMPDFNLLLCLG